MKEVFKQRFEYIIGVLALMISLSNFKDELKVIIINLGFLKFNLAEYFLYLILAAIVSLHFYFIPEFFPIDKSFYMKFKKGLHIISFTILFFCLMTPFALGLGYLIIWITSHLLLDSKTMADVVHIISSLLAIVSFILAFLASRMKYRIETTELNKNKAKQNSMEEPNKNLKKND